MSDLELFKSVGFQTTIKASNYTWDFDSKYQLEDFCYHFFHLVNLEKDKIYKEIKKYLIVKELPDNKISWDWRLLYFISKVPVNKNKNAN